MVFATEQTVKSKTYLERVHILQHDVLVDEIALPGSLVRDIASLLPIQRCHTQSDFEALLSLYSVDGWKCDSPEWMELLKRYLLTQQLSPSTRDIGGIVL